MKSLAKSARMSGLALLVGIIGRWQLTRTTQRVQAQVQRQVFEVGTLETLLTLEPPPLALQALWKHERRLAVSPRVHDVGGLLVVHLSAPRSACDGCTN